MMFYCISFPLKAQETMRNAGKIQMHPASEMAFYSDFINETNFDNNFGRVHFVGSVVQTIQGFIKPLQFEKVVLDNTNSLLIRVPVFNTNSLEFKKGIISTPRNTPSVNWSFGDGATYSGATNRSHIFGYAAKIGNDSFAFPIGDGQRLRKAAISAPSSNTASFKAAYFKGSPSTATLPLGGPFPTSIVSPADLKVTDGEYWDIDGSSPVRLTLSWNVQSNLALLAEDDISRVVVVAWDGLKWINLGASSISGDLVGDGLVTSRLVVPDSFSVFTLGVYKATCVANAPKLDVGSDKVLCKNDSVKLIASGFARYQWQDGSTDSTFMVRQPGKIWLKAWDICGNSQTDLFEFVAPRNITLTTIPVKCYGESTGGILLSDTNNVRIKVNRLTRANSDLKNLAVGGYQVTIFQAEGCVMDTLVEIKQSSLNSIEIGKDTTHVNKGETIDLEAKLSAGFIPSSIRWSPPQYLSCTDCLKTKAKPIGKVTYRVEATDSLGCAVTDEIIVYVDRKEGLYIPNAFNPEKEEFTVLGTPIISKIVKMQIYDRWGTLIFEALNFKPDGSVGWNGSYKNQPLMRGTFVVTLEVEFANNEIKTFASEFLMAR